MCYCLLYRVSHLDSNNPHVTYHIYHMSTARKIKVTDRSTILLYSIPYMCTSPTQIKYQHIMQKGSSSSADCSVNCKRATFIPVYSRPQIAYVWYIPPPTTNATHKHRNAIWMLRTFRSRGVCGVCVWPSAFGGSDKKAPKQSNTHHVVPPSHVCGVHDIYNIYKCLHASRLMRRNPHHTRNGRSTENAHSYGKLHNERLWLLAFDLLSLLPAPGCISGRARAPLTSRRRRIIRISTIMCVIRLCARVLRAGIAEHTHTRSNTTF